MPSAANKSFVNSIFCWQLMEDKAEDYDFDYYSLTREMERAFSTTGSALMKVKELMERKQGQHETFTDYVRYAQLAF